MYCTVCTMDVVFYSKSMLCCKSALCCKSVLCGVDVVKYKSMLRTVDVVL